MISPLSGKQVIEIVFSYFAKSESFAWEWIERKKPQVIEPAVFNKEDDVILSMILEKFTRDTGIRSKRFNKLFLVNGDASQTIARRQLVKGKYIKFYKSFHKGFQNKKSNSLFKTNQSLYSRFDCTIFWGLKMKVNISIKTLVLIQGVLIIGTVAIKIFYEWVGVEHILPLYSVLWIATWLEVSKNTK